MTRRAPRSAEGAKLVRGLGATPVVADDVPVRGMSNERAKRALGWAPRHPRWRDGFREAMRA